MLPYLEDDAEFPPTTQALDEPNGLLAFGGALTPDRLLSAYRRGIFPWYAEPDPILWWSPDPRSVLLPPELHISRSLRKTLRSGAFSLAVDQNFTGVMRACAEPRADGLGTWINTDMIEAYSQLHTLQLAHSIEVLDARGYLVGGLYGVALGQAFFGESMFSRAPDASKVALVALVHILIQGGFQLIDCQMQTAHLDSLGARSVSRLDFEQRLAQTVDAEVGADIWHLPTTCGGLL